MPRELEEIAMRLSALLSEVQVKEAFGPARDPEIAQVTSDSRQVRPGALFVAVTGENHDGHAFLGEAAARGAAAAIVEQVEPAFPLSLPVVRVADSRAALALAAAAFYGHPARRLTLIGVTGSVGKTSTAQVLAHLLRAAGKRVGVVGSLGIDDGRDTVPTPNTTPDPVTLQRAFRSMVENGLDTAVMEVSSHALVQKRVHALPFDVGIFTNLLELEHSDFHPTFEAYVEAKESFLQHLLPQGAAVFSADNPHTLEIARRFPGRRLSFGLSPGAEVRGEVSAVTRKGTQIAIDCGSAHRLSLTLPLLGRHHALNILAAIAAAHVMETPVEALEEALGTLKPFRRRMELIELGDVCVLDDTVGHPASMDHLFETVSALECPGIVVAAAIRGNRGRAINAANGERLGYWCRKLGVRRLVVTSSEEVVSPLDRVEEGEKEAYLGALRRAGVAFTYAPRLEEACSEAVEGIEPGELLVLLGAQGMDEGLHFVRAAIGSGLHPVRR